MRASSQSNLSSGEALASAGAESSGSGGGRAVIRHMSHAVADDGVEVSSNNSNDDDGAGGAGGGTGAASKKKQTSLAGMLDRIRKKGILAILVGGIIRLRAIAFLCIALRMLIKAANWKRRGLSPVAVIRALRRDYPKSFIAFSIAATLQATTKLLLRVSPYFRHIHKGDLRMRSCLVMAESVGMKFSIVWENVFTAMMMVLTMEKDRRKHVARIFRTIWHRGSEEKLTYLSGRVFPSMDIRCSCYAQCGTMCLGDQDSAAIYDRMKVCTVCGRCCFS